MTNSSSEKGTGKSQSCCAPDCCSAEPTAELPSPQALRSLVRQKYGEIAQSNGSSATGSSCCGMDCPFRTSAWVPPPVPRFRRLRVASSRLP